jgi:hypothetical protein
MNELILYNWKFFNYKGKTYVCNVKEIDRFRDILGILPGYTIEDIYNISLDASEQDVYEWVDSNISLLFDCEDIDD